MSWPPDDIEMHDLGHGVKWSKAVDKDGSWIGILEWHVCERGELTAGGVYFEGAPDWIKGARWKLENESPLTISPSVLCRNCGLHGFIREGTWVPA